MAHTSLFLTRRLANNKWMGVELSGVATGTGIGADGRMAASRMPVDVMASMAACGWRELDDEVDEDRA